MALSAEAVARRAISGENLRHVMPRAWARRIVVKGTKTRDFGLMRGGGGEAVGSRDRERLLDLSGDDVYDRERRR